MPGFPFQFLLTDRDLPAPEGWVCQQAQAWKLHTDPRLPVVPVRARNGGRLGWLLGFPIGEDGRRVTDRVEVSRRNVEEWLYTNGGRFALILMSPEPRVYLDPFGSYGVVYSQALGAVASSVGLLPDGEIDEELVAAYDIPAKDHWYPFGLTGRRDVSRLLPNHCLKLEDWSVERHWPGTGRARFPLDDRQIFDRIGDLLERQIGAVTAEGRAALMLTAGQDSRLLLACAKRSIEQTDLVTTDVGDPSSELDCRVAGMLAERIGRPHEVLTRRAASPAQLDAWLNNTGRCVAGRAWRNTGTREAMDPDVTPLSGLGGELGRGYWWRRDDPRLPLLSVEELLQRMSLPRCDRVVEAGKVWMAGLPRDIDNRFLLELAYVEQRLGCWAGPQVYGYTGNTPTMLPFCHREIVRLMISLSPAAREQERLASEVIQRKWPELLSLPFNEEPGLVRYMHRARRQVGRVKEALRRRAVGLMAPAAPSTAGARPN